MISYHIKELLTSTIFLALILFVDLSNCSKALLAYEARSSGLVTSFTPPSPVPLEKQMSVETKAIKAAFILDLLVQFVPFLIAWKFLCDWLIFELTLLSLTWVPFFEFPNRTFVSLFTISFFVTLSCDYIEMYGGIDCVPLYWHKKCPCNFTFNLNAKFFLTDCNRLFYFWMYLMMSTSFSTNS